MSSSKVKSSSSILNILIIAVGVIFLFRAIIDFLTLGGLILPEILADWGVQLEVLLPLEAKG